jgi:hypothetical protein
VSERGNSRAVLFGFLMAVVILGGGLLWWTSRQPPPGSHEKVTLSEVWPVTLPAGYAPPELPPSPTAGNYTYQTIERAGPPTDFRRTIEPDGTVKGRGPVTICVEPANDDHAGCDRGSANGQRVSTKFKDIAVWIWPDSPWVPGVTEWRGIAFTDDVSTVTWLRR